MEIADIGTDIVAVPRMQVFLDRPSLMDKPDPGNCKPIEGTFATELARLVE